MINFYQLAVIIICTVCARPAKKQILRTTNEYNADLLYMIVQVEVLQTGNTHFDQARRIKGLKIL